MNDLFLGAGEVWPHLKTKGINVVMSIKPRECLSCGVDTKDEFYFLKNEIWLKVHNSIWGFLCIGCAETRLERKLNKNDFTNAYINNPKFGSKSLRLIDRLTSGN